MREGCAEDDGKRQTTKGQGEAGGRLCPRETHGRPWPCEWVARRHCVKRRGERQYVAKTRSECSGKRRDGAKRKVSEGSYLRLAMMAVVPAPLWHFPVFRTCNVRTKNSLSRRFCSGRVTSGTTLMPLCALRAVVQNRFGIYPLVEGPGRQVHPKTTTFCPVLGFTTSREACRAHQSQNDLEQLSPERPGAGRWW